MGSSMPLQWKPFHESGMVFLLCREAQAAIALTLRHNWEKITLILCMFSQKIILGL